MVLQGHCGRLGQLVFNADGRRLAGFDSTLDMRATTPENRAVWVWDADRPKAAPTEFRGFEQGVSSVAFSEDGRRLIGVTLSGTAQARVWDLNQPTADPLSWPAHDRSAVPLLITPDGRWMLTSGEASDARLWDLLDSPPKSIDLLPRSQNVIGVPAYSTDRERRLLALVGADATARIWDLKAWTEPPIRLPMPVKHLDLSADGQRLITLHEDGTLRLWELSRPTLPSVVLADHRPPAVATKATPAQAPPTDAYRLLTPVLSPDGRWLVVSTRGDVAWAWDLEHSTAAPRRLGNREVGVEAFVFDRNRPELIYTVGGGIPSELRVVRAWSLEKSDAEPKIVGQFRARGPSFLTVDRPTSRLIISPDSKRLVAWSTGQEARVIWVWDLSRPGAPPAELRGNEQSIIAASLSPDGRWLVSVGLHQSARLWDLSNLDVAGARLHRDRHPATGLRSRDLRGRRFLGRDGWEQRAHLSVRSDP